MLKGLYGLRSSAHGWHEHFKRDLLKWGFIASTADPCLFSRVGCKDGSLGRILLFVDVMAIFTDPDSHLLTDLKRQVTQKYNCSPSDDKNVFLGMAVDKTYSGGYMLNQRRYIADVCKKFGVDDCLPVYVPMKGEPVSKEDCLEGDPLQNPLRKNFVEIIGSRV